MSMTVEDFNNLINELYDKGSDYISDSLSNVVDEDVTASRLRGVDFAIAFLSHKREELVKFDELNETQKKQSARAEWRFELQMRGLRSGSAAMADRKAEETLSKMSDDEVIAAVLSLGKVWNAKKKSWERDI